MIVDNKSGRNRLYLGEHYPDIYFTQREIDCMVHLLQNKTLSEIASEIGLSKRTVEFYVRNMRYKLMVKRKKELIVKVQQSAFLDQIKLGIVHKIDKAFKD